MQAFVNNLILDPEKQEMLKKVHKANLVPGSLLIIQQIGNNVLQFKKSDGKSMRNVRHFVAFIVHTLRLVIVCQSIDRTMLEPESIRILLGQVLRRLAIFEKIFP